MLYRVRIDSVLAPYRIDRALAPWRKVGSMCIFLGPCILNLPPWASTVFSASVLDSILRTHSFLERYLFGRTIVRTAFR